jgi:hypothetical protein
MEKIIEITDKVMDAITKPILVIGGLYFVGRVLVSFLFNI